ncbi:hypothetical protein [Streptomyces sp. PAN_FS17]|uniref:hypothetical protein n=1 Tax=Streptomyces sp. PAN_FS17 TaxID=1855351 RepID=UPI000896A055|nr:hypothetical protein [Streptomyces sp. PAN_FS17]SEB59102.1 hypothetical protein SAMN05216482_0077 [Streptomyces sp. PAN_FS17]
MHTGLRALLRPFFQPDGAGRFPRPAFPGPPLVIVVVVLVAAGVAVTAPLTAGVLAALLQAGAAVVVAWRARPDRMPALG